LRAKLLVVTSFALLIATMYVVVTYGQSVYFVAFHRPLHLGFSSSSHYISPVLPSFQVNQSIAAQTLTPGETQRVTLTAKPDQNLQGYIEVWITSPANKQVFRSNTDGNPTQFTKGSSQTYTFSYTVPKNLPKGTYKVSVTITSTDTFTDYYVKPNFATFIVS
jgi:hypothetical protein